MAKHVLYNASVTVNAVDLSSRAETVMWEEGIEDQRADAMGDIQKYGMAGLVIVSPIQVTFYQDYAASNVYATIHPLVVARSTFTVTIKADAGANATTNPAFSCVVYVGKFSVFNGTHGDRHMTSVTFNPAAVQSIATS